VPEVNFERFLGINNIADPSKNGIVVTGDNKVGIGLTKALNVDIDNNYAISVRKGKTKISSLTAHSLSNDAPGYFVLNNTLCKIIDINTTNNTITHEVLYTGLTAGTQYRMRYLEIGMNDVIYFCNGVDNGVVRNGEIDTWGVEGPNSFYIQSVAGGILRIGTYRILLTYVNESGQESGANYNNGITITSEGQSISISNIAVSSGSTIKYINIYVTEVNGSVFYLKGTINNGDTSFIIHDTKNMGVPIDNPYVMAPPVGEMLTLYNGRIYVAKGRNIYYSDSYRYERFSIEWLPFKSNIRMLRAVGSGIWISTDNQTIFLEGSDVSEFRYKLKAEYPSVKHTDVSILGGALDEYSIIWMSTRGACVGSDVGDFKNLTEDFYVPNISSSDGVGLFKQENGMNQFISILNNVSENIEKFSNVSITRNVRDNFNPD